MRIRMRACAAGPAGTFDAGQVCTVPDATAAAWIACGAAEACEPLAVPKSPPGKPQPAPPASSPAGGIVPAERTAAPVPPALVVPTEPETILDEPAAAPPRSKKPRVRRGP